MKKATNPNIKLQIACLIFAFFAWIYVMSELDPIDTREIPFINVKITNIDELDKNNFVLSPNQDLIVKAKIKGKRSVIAKKVKDGISLQATVKDAKIGENQVQVVPSIETSDISYEITPKYLKLNFEENAKKTEKIQINSIGNLENGTSIDLIKLSKNTIEVTGPKSLIQKLSKVQIDVDFSGKSTDFSGWYPLRFLDFDDNEIVGVFVDTAQVMATVTTKKEKVVPILVDFDLDGETFYADVTPKEIKIYGKENVINNIQEIYTQSINPRTLKNNQEVLVNLVIPEGINADVKSVKIKLEE